MFNDWCKTGCEILSRPDNSSGPTATRWTWQLCFFFGAVALHVLWCHCLSATADSGWLPASLTKNGRLLPLRTNCRYSHNASAVAERTPPDFTVRNDYVSWRRSSTVTSASQQPPTLFPPTKHTPEGKSPLFTPPHPHTQWFVCFSWKG